MEKQKLQSFAFRTVCTIFAAETDIPFLLCYEY